MTDCASVRELLPWHLGGSLAEAEAAAVAAHLEGCAACRDELEATRAAAAVFAAHPPAADLVAWAAGEMTSSSEAVAVHLATCPECREEVALAEAARTALEAAPSPRRRTRRWLGLAAALLVAVTAGIAWVALNRGVAASRSQVATLAQRVDRLEGEAHELEQRLGAAGQAATRMRDELEAARRRLTERAGARLDVRVLELLPGTLTLRGSGPEAPPRAPVDRLLSLLLVREGAQSFARYRLSVRDRSGATRWQEGGLSPQPDGDVALVVPASLLGEGDLTLLLEGETRGGGWTKVGEYRLEVTAPAKQEAPAGKR